MIVIPVIVSLATVGTIAFLLNVASDGELFALISANREVRVAQRIDEQARVIVAPVVLCILVVAIMYFTNRFLTKFVFKKIQQPLDLLSSGVHQISEGNLDHKITYTEQDEFKPVCEAFNNMAAQLKASVGEVQKNEQNRKELLAGISHDLRSPLTSIKGFVEGLLDGVANTPESQREYLQIIKQKTDDINNMVSQLFYYSKMDMGNYPTNAEVLNVANEIKDFVSASQEEYRAKGLIIDVGGMSTERYILADPLQLRSVFANILGNSAKYAKREGNDTARALINCVADNGTVRIIFEDDGIGVSENVLPKMFDAFYRADPSRNNPNQGSGLGLAIAAKALERMNGGIYAENIKAGGLRIVVEIPAMKEKGEIPK